MKKSYTLRVAEKMKVTIADLNIDIKNKYEYLERACKAYLSEFERDDLEISVTEDEISSEDDGTGFSRGYLESLAVYRKIADKLSEYDGLLIHGVLMQADGKGILLTAPSGVGKTTHARMWLAVHGKEHCRIVNGDKPLVRFIDGKAYAYGTPWCGKEGLNINCRIALDSIAFIERATENRTFPITVDEALVPFFKQIHFPKEQLAHVKVFELCGRLAESVEFYKIKCTPETKAAVEARRVILYKEF